MNKTTEDRINSVGVASFRGYMAYLNALSDAAKDHYREDSDTFELSAWIDYMLDQTPYDSCLVVWHLERWYCRKEHGYDPYRERRSADLTDVDYNDVSGIGTKTASSIVAFIRDNNIRRKRQLLAELRKNIDSVDGLGEGNMTNLEDYFDLPDREPEDDDSEPEESETDETIDLDVLEYDYTAVNGLGPSTQENIRDFIRDRGIETMSTLLTELEENLDDVSRLGPTTLERLSKKVEDQ